MGLQVSLGYVGAVAIHDTQGLEVARANLFRHEWAFQRGLRGHEAQNRRAEQPPGNHGLRQLPLHVVPLFRVLHHLHGGIAFLTGKLPPSNQHVLYRDRNEFLGSPGLPVNDFEWFTAVESGWREERVLGFVRSAPGTREGVAVATRHEVGIIQALC